MKRSWSSSWLIWLPMVVVQGSVVLLSGLMFECDVENDRTTLWLVSCNYVAMLMKLPLS